jgi:hypothetical protein
LEFLQKGLAEPTSGAVIKGMLAHDCALLFLLAIPEFKSERMSTNIGQVRPLRIERILSAKS